MFNRSGESGLPHLVFVLRGKASSFTSLGMMLAVAMWYMDFTLLRIFLYMNIKFCQCFICTYWDYMISTLHFVNRVYKINWFANIELFLNPWNESYLIIVYDFLILYHIHFEDFCLYFHWGYWPAIWCVCLCVCVCVCVILVWLLYQENAGLVKWFWTVLSFIFWKSLRMTSIDSSVNIW